MATISEPGGSGLAQASAGRLRAMIYDTAPGDRLGSLRSIAETLGVGIVTVQQAARVLEHEGLLEVRRGPNGGYYASRPDAASLERALTGFIRGDQVAWEEVLDITSLLFSELAAAAALCRDKRKREPLSNFLERIDEGRNGPTIAELEQDFQDILFTMVDRPLIELLTRVALRFAAEWSDNPLHQTVITGESWRLGRRRIIAAILDNDPELARFEANRNNRQLILRTFDQATAPDQAAKP